MSTICFGTDGWRGIISKDFTMDNLDQVIQAIGAYFRKRHQDLVRLVIGYDARFMSRLYAERSAEILRAWGIEILLSHKICSTPAISYAVTHYQAQGGIMITASHNPYYYNGVKIKEAFGGSALPQTTKGIESLLNQIPPLPSKPGTINVVDVETLYLTHLLQLVDFRKANIPKLKIVVDPMFGSCINYFTTLLKEYDNFTVVEINNYHNPSFNGINPEPIQENLSVLQQAVKDSEADLGLAFDGDGDRLGAVDCKGNFVSPQQLFPLLVEAYLVKNSPSALGIGKTCSTTSLIDKLCHHYITPVFETPIGFKYLCQLFLENKVALAGEESGGFGFADHLPERDGVLSALRLVAYLCETGSNVTDLINNQHQRFGTYYYNRLDLRLTDATKAQLLDLLKHCPPDRIAGEPVVSTNTLDGYKFFTAHGWLLLRFSGTEPLLRIYAEAENLTQVNSYLTFAQSLVHLGRR